MRGKITQTIFILALLLIPALVSATPVTVGDPLLTHSWVQRFEESGVGNFDMMEAFMMSPGDAFESPGFTNFTDGSWSGNLLRSDYIKATGNILDWLQFDINFEGSTSDPLTFDFLSWEGTVLRDWVTAQWTGSGWNIAINDTGTYNPSTHNRAVPEPSTLMLLGAGIVGIVLFGRKVLRK